MSTLRELELEQTAPRLLEVLRRQGLARLTKFQMDAIEQGIMRRTNQLLVTVDYDEAYQIAEIALLNRVASDFKAKGIVVCPNPHQAEKKFQSLSQKCRRLGIESTEIIRRRKAIRQKLGSGRVIVATYQSLGIAISLHPEILEDVECVLVDRLDLIGQPQLGATLESALVTLMGSDSEIQYIGILPPVLDLDELSQWMNARIVEDFKQEVRRIYSVKAFEEADESLADLTEFVHYRHGQIIILCADSSTSEELAGKLSGTIESDRDVALDLRLSPEQRDDLRHQSIELGRIYPDCDMTERLEEMFARGVAFFHEGVSRAQRRLISRSWKQRELPVLVMPTGFAMGSDLRSTIVFLMGVFMQETDEVLSDEDSLTMLSEWRLNDVFNSAGRTGIDNEAFGIVVVDNQTERERVLAKYFNVDSEGNIRPRLGEVDSAMDDPENAQDLVLRQICGGTRQTDDPYSVLDRSYWAESNRTTSITSEEILATDNASVEALVSLRATKTTADRAEEIPDKDVRLVSVNPVKIEGLVHSATRDLWHHVVLRAGEGVSCTCESWKFQGIRRHRLCKHLVKFASFALNDDDSKPYARSVTIQALRGLEILRELESDGLIVREKDSFRCSTLGRNVSVLGVPVKDAKAVMRTLGGKKGELNKILLTVSKFRTGLPRSMLKRTLDRVSLESLNEIVAQTNDPPGVVENIVEEIQYINSILLRLMAGSSRRGLNKESFKLDQILLKLLDEIG
ncbi:MAG: hypothetical protein JSW61_10700 [Candidatus Thorarchaeota archaeon]|nr:MAG: hypothetical protein JSW61_10700 [Candidatus Thorarchaeota archaeon]